MIEGSDRLRVRRLTVSVVVLVLFAASCGDDDSSGFGGPFGSDDGFDDVFTGDDTDTSVPSGEDLADQILRDAFGVGDGDGDAAGGQALDVELERITGFEADHLAVDGTTVWVTDTDNDVIRSIDLSTGEVGDDIAVGDAPAGIAAENGEVWVANSGSFDHTVMRLDGSSGEIELTIETDAGTSPSGVALTDDHVWVGIASGGEVAQIDRATGEIVAIAAEEENFGGGARQVDVLATDAAIWSTDRWCGRVVRIDRETAEIVTILDEFGFESSEPETCTGTTLAAGAARLAAFDGGVFVLAAVANEGRGEGRIYRIDEATDEVSVVVELPFAPSAAIGRAGLPGLVVEEGGIWFGTGDRLLRIDRAGGPADGVYSGFGTVVAAIEVDAAVWSSLIVPSDIEQSGLYGVDTGEADAAAG